MAGLDAWQNYRIEVLNKSVGVLDATVKIQADIDELTDQLQRRKELMSDIEAGFITEVSAEMVEVDKKMKPKYGNAEAREAEVKMRCNATSDFLKMDLKRKELEAQIRSKRLMLNSHNQQIEIYKAFLKGS